MPAFNQPSESIISELNQHKSDLEQFIINGYNTFWVGLKQRDDAVIALEAENETLRSQVATAESNLAAAQNTINERDNSLVTAANYTAELEQRIANLNAAIDAAQQA